MESAFFMILSALVAVALLYFNYRNRRCYKCGKKVTSKKYLYFSPPHDDMLPVCEDCFFDVVTKNTPEEKRAN